MQGFFTFAAIYISTAFSPFVIRPLLPILPFRCALLLGSIFFTYLLMC